MNDIKVDLGSAAPFLYDRLLTIFGRDSETQAFVKWFSDVQLTAYNEASSIQCIGMHNPVPLLDIYQPTKLFWETLHLYAPTASGRVERQDLPQGYISPQHFLCTATSAIIFAGPGWGKTTFLHYLYISTLDSDAVVPALFTLRRPEALTSFFRFIENIEKIKKTSKKGLLLLLVDGYDEISDEDRKRVSDALLRYSPHGRFYLTCRDFYDVYELKIPAIRLAPFDRDDQIRYVEAFTKVYGGKYSSANLVIELEGRGLADLLQHPLLLTLTCIVKSGPMSITSRSVLGLIERAIETLSFRWDEGKGIARDSRLPLDGRDRIKCLTRIAFQTRTPDVNAALARKKVQEQLDLLRWEHIDPLELLLETARFYGVFVPISDEAWTFVHKTLHDYLAAKHWVESGRFLPSGVKDWDTRAAYAACLTLDATESMLITLANHTTRPVFAEMLSNDASFDHDKVGRALVTFYSKQKHFHENSEPLRVSVQLSQDFVSIAPSKFLFKIVDLCSETRSISTDALCAYALDELSARNQRLPSAVYAKALALFRSPNFKFTLNKAGAWRNIELRTLAPAGSLTSSPASSKFK